MTNPLRAEGQPGLEQLLSAFRLTLTAEGLSPTTVGNYVSCVDRFFRDTGKEPERVRPSDIRQFVIEYGDGRSPKTVREAQIGVRRFFRFLVDEGDIDDNPAERIRLVNYRPQPQAFYTEEEVGRLFSSCDLRTKRGVRDLAILSVLYDTGPRVGELISMSLPNFDSCLALVSGKTGPRYIPLGVRTVESVSRYIRRWRVREAPLWRSVKGKFTESGVHQMIDDRCEAVGIPPKGVHAFRRTAAAQMKRLGMNDSDIMEIMGWESIVMLRRYTAGVADELAQQAHRRFSPADSLRR